jgi:NAD-dependent SIR2 family protein deacetylase
LLTFCLVTALERPLDDRTPRAQADALAAWLRGRRPVVLTGAGLSTESGIPDYRGKGRVGPVRSPIQHRAFLDDPMMRARYWARSAVGWPRFSSAQPNAGHHALAALERAGRIAGILTQNVDRLHHAAGSENVIELHGALATTRCLACNATEPRVALQERLRAANPSLVEATTLAPDGDADLAPEAIKGFVVPECLACGSGPLKPDVVFFGDNVPRERVDRAFAMLDASDALLVIGTSLAVFSGFRFVRRAHEQNMPIAIVNDGETRGDPYATLRIEARTGEVLSLLA